MPGITSLGLRYPELDDVVDATSYQNLADDIEAQMALLDVKRTLAKLRPSARLTDTFSATAGVVTTATTGFEQRDTASLVSAGPTDRINMTSAGVWLVTADCSLSGFTTCTSLYLSLLNSGVFDSGNQIDNAQPLPVVPVYVVRNRSVAMIINQDPAAYLQFQVLWGGTGGPATVSTKLAAIKLRGL